MSSWVAPAVAAEIWGWTVEQVLAAISNGTAHSRTEGGFSFVDATRFPGPRIPTFKPASDDEFAQFTPPPEEAIVSAQEIAALGLGPESDSDEAPIDDSPGPDVSQWRTNRAATARLRWPPQSIPH